MTKEIYEALQAICEGCKGTISDGLIIVENPDASPEALALGGVNPSLVIDTKMLLALLDPR